MRFKTTTDLSKEFYPVPKQQKQEKKQKTEIKKKSKKQANLERNRFSIITDDLEHCYICMERGIKDIPRQDLHEVYGGRNRRRSIENGLVVPLCRKCHQDEAILEWLKRFVQLEYEENNTRDDFVRLIGKSYIKEEEK